MLYGEYMLQTELTGKRKVAGVPSEYMQAILKKKQRYKLEKFIKRIRLEYLTS